MFLNKLNRLKKIFLLFVTCLVCINVIQAQTNEGTDFWFGFMEHINPTTNRKVVLITSKINTSGTIQITGLGTSQNFTVAANSVTSIELPDATEFLGSEFIQETSVHVQSQGLISVYIHQFNQARSEATIVLPTSSISNEYFVMSYTGISSFIGRGVSEFLVVAVEDETEISYTLADRTQEGSAIGEMVNVQLQQGETYQVRAADFTDDLTGTLVSGDKNFYLFAGASFSGVPAGCGSFDNLLEIMTPIDTWGSRFVSVPTNEDDVDVFRILASENQTNIVVSTNTGVIQNLTLGRGEFEEYSTAFPSFIESDKPILVAQYLIGQDCTSPNDLQGDPSMLILNSVEQIRDTVTLFNSSLQNIRTNFINIICRTDEIDLVSFDGSLIQQDLGGNFLPIANSEFSYIRYQTNAGAHTIINPGCGVIASAYGFGERETYAYSGGASFNRINANQIPDGGCRDADVVFSSGLPPERYELEWDIGDNQAVRTDDDFTHVYSDLGTYPAQLIIFDRCFNEFDTLNKDLIISLRQAVEAIDMVEVCAGESISLTAEDSGIDIPIGGSLSYEWTGPPNLFIEEQNPEIMDASTDMTGLFEVIGIVSGCETTPAFADITVHENPTLFLGADSVFCNKTGQLPILDAGAFDSYLWDNGTTNQFREVDVEGTYTVEVSDVNQCSGTASISYTLQCPTQIYIPTAFSPNGDNINDDFGVFGDDIISMQFKIFDRWGNELFITEDQSTFWNGSFKGKQADRGVYAWVLELQGFAEDGSIFNETRSGTFQLLR